MTVVERLDSNSTLASHARVGYVPHVSPSSHPLKPIRVALAGCGVVGGALVRLLDECSDAIASRHGVRVEIARVLVRDTTRDRGLPLSADIFTSDIGSFLSEDVDLVIEAIGGQDAAAVIARGALGNGRRFITANKELIASSGNELARLARESCTSLDFGAAVGGSVPVISLLRDLLGASLPRAVRGILNGTSNYVLTQLERGHSFEQALSAARARGLAEADSSRDLDGSDAAAKLAIVAWISFGISPALLPIRRIGLSPDAARLVRHADELGSRIRLIAECFALSDQRICASVEPVVFDSSNAFARTELEDNRVEVDLGWSAPLCVSGPGAGGPPTATALLGDILSFSGRRNDRGPARIRYEAVDDPRVHRWLVVADCPVSVLEQQAGEGGIQVESADTTCNGARLVVSAAWPALESSLRRLRDRGILPALARVDATSSSVPIQ